MTTRDDVHDRPVPPGAPDPTAPAGPSGPERPDPPRSGEDPVAVLRRLAAGGVGGAPQVAGGGGGPLRAWEAVRSGRWSTTPTAALGVGLVALLVCAAVLVRAHLLAPDPAAAGAGQRVAIAATAEGRGTDGAPVDPAEATASGAAGPPTTADAGPAAGLDPATVGPAATGPAATRPAATRGASPGSTGPDAVGAAGASAPPALVHVVGQVRAPGVVEVAAGGRVADAVAAAGGLTPEADASALNLARAVVDGEQVVVPRPGEVPVVVPAPPAAGAAPPAAAAGGGATAAGGPVPLDTATAAELDALPGIGPVLAQRIVEWREAHGGFTSTDELGEVSGIGDKVLEQLRPLVAA